MKNQISKKLVSLILVFTLLFSACIPALAGNAESDITPVISPATTTQEEKTPIVFVNGIGQSWTYQLSEDGEKQIECNGETYKYISVSNLFNFTSGSSAGKFWLKYFFSSPKKALNALKSAFQLLVTLFTPKYALKEDNVRELVDDLLYQNIRGEDEKLPSELFTPCYNCPVSELPYDENNSMCGRTRFFRCIPCEDILKEYG